MAPPYPLSDWDLELPPNKLPAVTRELVRSGWLVEAEGKLLRRPGEVLSRYRLLEHAWDYGYESRSNVVDVYVRYLREKIDRPFGRDSLETVRGVGYRLRADGEP